MKKIYSIIVALLLSLFCGYAQEMSVQSFVLAETDLTANTPGTMKHDQNGNVAALIKVETTQKGFTFDVGMLGVIDVVEHPAEIWVYVPFGIRKMTIQHPQLGMLRDYQFPCAIEKGRTYIMKLTAGNVRTIVEHAVTRQFLYIELDPSDAILEINGKIKATDNGVYQELMQFGKYTYKAYSQNYHDLVGMVEISDPVNTHSLTLKLKAAFGHLSVLPTAQQDLSGAAVYVDDKYIGQVPIRDLQLSSGSHSIRIIKEMYEAYNETFTIKDEEKKILTPKLVSDFAEVTLVTGNDADIYINGERKGKHTWTGRLASGSYLLESRQAGHVSFQMPYDLSRKDHGQTIRIQDPTPVYGSLVISSTPAKARILIDGKYVGDTPKFISNQIVGEHVVTAEKEGYEKQSRKVTVNEGAELDLSFSLKKNEYLVSASFSDNSVLKVKGIEYPMVFVEGGSFMMGSDERYADDNEKPAHEVTLSSYWIGKYEVTQELWQAVMGTNPSEFKGPRRPVEIVSWNDCQVFIRKLNNLTGKNFKLPTEAQWEFAARGGNKSKGYKYSGSNTIESVGWCQNNSMYETHDVGTKVPNELGIYDMTGNVWEWCSDWEGPYNVVVPADPSGPSTGTHRIQRGGCWSNNDGTVINRFSNYPDHRHISLGLRLCLDGPVSSTKPETSSTKPEAVLEEPAVPSVPDDEEEAIPFQLVEVKASFQGGDANQFSKWVNQRLVYPDIARENGVQGRVTLQFTIRKDGSISNIKVIRGVDPALDKEAVRVVSMSPKWTPGKMKGKAVAVTYTFPVIFQLQ